MAEIFTKDRHFVGANEASPHQKQETIGSQMADGWFSTNFRGID
jgi:hypothetical protein